MTRISKIKRYGLGNRTLALWNEGKTQAEIAHILTEDLHGKTSITQTAVWRYLRFSARAPLFAPQREKELQAFARNWRDILDAFIHD